MSDQKLARMANSIADFFKSYPHDHAVTGIHDHMKAFWTPKMRATLAEAVETGTVGFHPLVIDAVRHGTGAESPTGKEAAGPAEVGEIGASDAG